MINLKPFFKIRPCIQVILLVSLANLILYWPVRNFEFIILDDPAYVLLNPIVQNGLTLDGIKWAFTTIDYNTANWHPLAWISLMLDWQFYGEHAGGYHGTNVILHMLNTILLLIVLRGMTGSLWRSAFVAVLFAVHPLHVESVAWISERKDVLCMFFWLLATWTYSQYVNSAQRWWYVLTALLFVFALLAKPMAVTFPFVLLLLDYWPLRRFNSQVLQNNTHGHIVPFIYFERSDFHLLLEKVPLVILSLLSSIITYAAQASSNAVQTLINFPLLYRLENAFVSYINYVLKMLWPQKLAVIYPLPPSWPLWHVTVAVILVFGMTGMVMRHMKDLPYLFTGWCWYMGSLVPVIGLVQVGNQSMADRYTYFPLIGLFIIVAWGMADILRYRQSLRILLYPLSLFAICALMITSWHQVQTWRSSLSLFKQALAVTKENYLAENDMGIVLQNLGNLEDARLHLTEALRIRPKFPDAHTNLGVIYFQQKKYDLAEFHLRQAISLAPQNERAHFNLGQVYLMQKEYEEAITEYRKAIMIKPNNAEAHNYMGVALICQINIDAAIKEFSEALRIQPQYRKAHLNLFRALEMRKRVGSQPQESP